MPEGSAQQNLMGEPVNQMGNFDDPYEASPEEPADDNPPGGSQQNESGGQNTDAMEQAQLAAQQQAEVAIGMEASKQRQLRQIQAERQKLEGQLGELEKDLTDFKNSKLGGFLKIFQPRINLLIDILIDQMKKQANNMADEAKVGYYTGLIITVSSLIAMLTALKFIAAVLDAAFLDNFSCLRLVIASSVTVVIPIILILISPIYIPFLAVIFLIGKIPLAKGKLTKNIIDLIEKLKNQRTAWQAELDKVKKKVTLRRQIKTLKNMEKRLTPRR